MSDPIRDELAIQRLVARTCHAVSEGDEDAWADGWTPDGEWRVLGQVLRGREQVVAHYRKLLEGVVWVVQVAQNGILEVEGDAARGRWLLTEYVQARGGGTLLNLGRYRDTYARCADGQWRYVLREFHARYLGPPDLSGAARELPAGDR